MYNEFKDDYCVLMKSVQFGSILSHFVYKRLEGQKQGVGDSNWTKILQCHRSDTNKTCLVIQRFFADEPVPLSVTMIGTKTRLIAYLQNKMLVAPIARWPIMLFYTPASATVSLLARGLIAYIINIHSHRLRLIINGYTKREGDAHNGNRYDSNNVPTCGCGRVGDTILIYYIVEHYSNYNTRVYSVLRKLTLFCLSQSF